ncbi:MAG: pyridoxamine 5'-phosphate oxidase family protein [Candidatus Accumulibacter sp.]|jgi:nitroimidazol reductase NimA-like FMN-containing flavoprotein (pyridoxamine 5'-phosphate oxidase superfamily)|nr:pyridoxamine 5'-phosphate oxidase family protein [Accumulibacter sp.]
MEHELRRKDRAVGHDECLELLARGAYGVLATLGEDGEPYPVPLSYVFLGGKIYFHCARQGRKLDNIRACPRVGFTVVGHVQPVFENNFSTLYESVIVFGQASEVTDSDEKYAALYALAEKYLPEHIGKADDYIKRSFPSVAVFAVVPERMSGKARRGQKTEDR